MKYVNTKHQPQLASELAEFFTEVESATWQEIMAFVSTKWQVKNWMGPRGALQSVLDSGLIERVGDTGNEIYRICEES